MSNYPINEDMNKYFREDTTDTTVTLTPKKEEGPLRIEIPSSHKDQRVTFFHGPSSEIRNLPGYSFLDQAARDRELSENSAVFNLDYDIYGNRRPEGFLDYFRYFKQVLNEQTLWNAHGWRGMDRQRLSHIHNPHVETYRADPISSLSITFRASSIIFLTISAFWIINPTDSFGFFNSILAVPGVFIEPLTQVLHFNSLDSVLYVFWRAHSFLENSTIFFSDSYTPFVVDPKNNTVLAVSQILPYFYIARFLPTISSYITEALDFSTSIYTNFAITSRLSKFSHVYKNIVEKLFIFPENTPDFSSPGYRGSMSTFTWKYNWWILKRAVFHFPTMKIDQWFSITKKEQFGYMSQKPWAHPSRHKTWIDFYAHSVQGQGSRIVSFDTFTSIFLLFSFSSTSSYLVWVGWLVLVALLTVHATHGISHNFMDQSIGTDDIRTQAPFWRFLERFFFLVVFGIL